MADRARHPEALELEIEHSRAELARTIDAIVDRVSPKRVAQRGAFRLKDGAASFVSAVGDRLHPSDGLFLPDEMAEEPDGVAEPIELGDDGRLPGRDGPSPTVLLVGAGVALAATAIAVVVLRRRWRRR